MPDSRDFSVVNLIHEKSLSADRLFMFEMNISTLFRLGRRYGRCPGGVLQTGGRAVGREGRRVLRCRRVPARAGCRGVPVRRGGGPESVRHDAGGAGGPPDAENAAGRGGEECLLRLPARGARQARRAASFPSSRRQERRDRADAPAPLTGRDFPSAAGAGLYAGCGCG